MTNKTCPCGQTFTVSDFEKVHLDKISPVFSGQKYGIPEPDICPDCRSQLRVSHRNEQFLYHNTSAFSEKPIISVYGAKDLSPNDKQYKVVTNEEWWSDSYNGIEYGRDFDFSRTFFEQFHELDKDVPRTNLVQVNNENSPYTTGTGYCKNCHMVNSSEYAEDCYYGKLYQTCTNVVDSMYMYDSELCYECFNLRNCYNCMYLYNSQNCNDCFFSDDLKGCKNCLFCTNLKQKEYYIHNKAVPKDEFQKMLNALNGSYERFKQALEVFQKIRLERIYKYVHVVSSENSTGDFVLNSKNVVDCYDMTDSEDCMYVQVGVNIKDVVDSSNMYLKPELCYQILGTIEGYNIAFSTYVFYSQYVYYSNYIYHSKNCFGCTGLKKNEYCILNKQYSKEEYESLVPRIIEHMKQTGEWGRFFPAYMSPFGYNESLANDYFSLTKENVMAKGFKWREEDARASYEGPDYVIPDMISEVKDNVTEAILRCEVTGKPYKIMPQELKFYRNMKLPLPRKSPDQRYLERLQLRNPRRLWERHCMKCNMAIHTTYAPDRQEKVYCEECYLNSTY